MFEFLKGKKEEDDTVVDDTNTGADGQANKTGDKVVHAMESGDTVPQAVKDVLAKVRGEQDPDFTEVEVDADGNAINPEQAELLKSSSVVKDDDAPSGDAVDQGDSAQKSDEAEAVDSSAESDEINLDDLDPRLVAAGKTMNWSEDKVRLIAETDVTILEDIATRLEASETHRHDTKDDKEDDTGNSGQPANEALAKLKEKLGDDADDLIGALTKGIEEKFESRFKEVDDFRANRKKEDETNAAIQRGTIADDVFDQAAEHFEEFGITEKLPRDGNGKILMDTPQVKLRNEVYRVASIFHQANGGTFEKAMVDAVQHYAGGQGVQVAVRQVVKDLKKNKTRFTPKPTRRRTVKVFKNENAKAAHIVQEAKRAAGIE